jgi:glutathione S-transferase
MSGATLFVVPGSHPSTAARLMLEHKRIAYRRVDLLPGIHKPLLRLLGFRDTTVPALRLDGRRIQSTLNISRALDQLRPERPLFPAGGPERAAVEEAERWGERVLQPVPRRLSWWAFSRDRGGLGSFAEGARLGVPLGLALRTAAPIVAIERRINGASDDAVHADMATLPGLLDHVDSLLEAGTIGADPPNAADYQIATSVRLLLCFEDLRGPIEQRPAGANACGLVPDFPGRVGPLIPSRWLARAARPG